MFPAWAGEDTDTLRVSSDGIAASPSLVFLPNTTDDRLRIFFYVVGCLLAEKSFFEREIYECSPVLRTERRSWAVPGQNQTASEVCTMYTVATKERYRVLRFRKLEEAMNPSAARLA